MSTVFPLLKADPEAKVNHRWETYRGLAYIMSFAFLCAAVRIIIRFFAVTKNLDTMVMTFLVISLFFALIMLVVKWSKKSEAKRQRADRIGLLTLADSYLLAQFDHLVDVKMEYELIDRIDIYYYEGIQPTTSRNENVYDTLEVFHIRIFAEDSLTHFYVENNLPEYTERGALNKRLNDLQNDSPELFKKIQFWAKFEEDR